MLSSDAIVVLPGGEGTKTQVMLALRYGRPLVAHGVRIGDGVPHAPWIEYIEAFLRTSIGC